jgi:hypothetical protein
MSFFVRVTIASVFCVSLGLAGVLFPGLSNSAFADAIISGTSNDVRVEANDTELAELLTGFRDKFGLAYNSLRPLDNKRINGTFTGPLISILARLLRDYDHALKVADGHVLLVLTDQQKSTAGASASQGTATVSTAPSMAAGPPARAGSDAAAGSSAGARVALTESTGSGPGTSSPQPSARTPYPFAVTNFLQTQAALLSRDSATASAMSGLQGAGAPGAAAMEQSLQHANQTLQSLAGALSKLPK